MNFSNKKDWKLFYNTWNAFITRKEPIHLTHFITERCNAHCPHCFVDTAKEKEELSLEQIEKISNSCGKALRNVSITGGEPFLREDIFEIANIWYKNTTAKSIAICSNGSMPEKTEQFAKLADKNNLPVSFFFSYDFIGEKHSEYRNLKDLHLKVLESYKIINNFYPKMHAIFNITVNDDNYSSAMETYRYLRDVLKAQNINCTMIRGEKIQKISDETLKQMTDVYEAINKEKNSDFNSGLIKGYTNKSLTTTVLNAKNKILWKYVLKTLKENKFISPCRAGSLFGIIKSNGDVFPCELLNCKIGNLKDFDYNFDKLWQVENAANIRQNIIRKKCFCTFECTWLLNIFSSPKYFAEILYYIIENSYCRRNRNE